jgi:lysozyme
MPVIEYEGQQYEFPGDASDEEIFDFLGNEPASEAPTDDVPEPLLPDGTSDYIKQNEGYRAKPYKDSLGIRTVGYGFNLQDQSNQALAQRLGVKFNKPLSAQDADKLFKHSVIAAEDSLRNLDPEYDNRPDGVKKALLDMSYNLGTNRLGEFEDMFTAIKSGDYKQAGFAVTKSLYASQVPVRARNNAKLLMQAAMQATEPRYTAQQPVQSYSEGDYEDEAGNQFYVDSNGQVNPARYAP